VAAVADPFAPPLAGKGGERGVHPGHLPSLSQRTARAVLAREAETQIYVRSCPVTIALPAEVAERRPFRLDLTWPILITFAVLLCVLIILPISWLIIYSITIVDEATRSRALTFEHFQRLFTDPDFVDPLVTTIKLAVSSSAICCAVAAPMGWLVARTDLPFTNVVRALITASFVTPPFLGAIAWEILAAPNSGLLNQLYRYLTGAPHGEYLLNIYSLPGLIFVISCYTFPYVFVLIANALDRIPGDLEDASSILGGKTWVTARRITIPLTLPALLAGVLIAFLQAMILFGSPAILALPAGFHTMTTKIWSLFQYPPKPELAAAASLPLLVVTVLLLRAQHMILGRKGYSVVGGKSGDPRLIKLGRFTVPAMVFVGLVLMLPVFLPYFALFNAAFSPIATTLLTPSNFTLHNIYFTFFELSSTKLALKNTLILGSLAATVGTALALVISYITVRQVVMGHRFLGFLATAPIAIPGIVLGVGLFLSYTRPPFLLYGTLWILLLAYVTIELPAAYQQLQSAFRAVHPELEDASRILGATRLRTLREVTAPLLRTSVIATWCFIFVSVVRELSAAIILFTSETKVVSVLIFDLKESGELGAISVLGISMLLLTFSVVILMNRIPGLGSPRLRNA
jgi:iron(III) transport system permease protein